MALNPSIILAGTQPDFVNVLRQSNAGAQEANQTRQQNALRQLYQEQGQGIAQGDPNALNALAQFDPQAALGVRQSMAGERRADAQLGMQERGLDMREQEFGMRVKEYASSIGAQQAAAEAEKIKQGIFAASAAQSPEQWDQVVTQLGQPELAGQFENKDALLRQYATAAQILEANKAEGPQSPQGKLAADLNAGLITPEQFNAANQKTGLRATIGPDGTFTVEENAVMTGGPSLGKPTEGQLAGAGYLQRMTGSERIIRELESEGVNAIPTMKSLAMDTRAEGYLLSPQEAKLAQAQRDWVRAKLRKESGAVIADEEMASEIKTYFPMPGEGPEIVAQKRAARERAERQMQIGSGSAAAMAGDLSPTEQEPQGSGVEFTFQNDEQRSVFEKYSRP